MNLARTASFVHKWLALLVGVQIVFWVASGLFFTVFPIATIRSEQLVRAVTPQPLSLDRPIDMAALRSAAGASPTRIAIDHRLGRDVIVADYPKLPSALFDAHTLVRLSPISKSMATDIARASIAIDESPRSVTQVSAETSEYRGPLPAWKVEYARDNLAVYVVSNTGAVSARRSGLWRLYDTMWALHIMDWRDHENFNHPLIIATALITFISVIAGIVLVPFRIRFRRSIS